MQHYYASVRRRAELEKEVEYWKERAEENQQTAWNDGMWTGVLSSVFGCIVIVCVGLLFFSSGT